MEKFINYLKDIKNQIQIHNWIKINSKLSSLIILFNFSLWVLYKGFCIIIYYPDIPKFSDYISSLLTGITMMLFIQCVIFYLVLMIMLYNNFIKK